LTNATAVDQVSQLMVDHPGWFIWTEHGFAQRAFRSGNTVWMISCRRAENSFQPVVEVVHQGTTPTNACPVVDTFDPRSLPPPIRRALLPDGATRIHRIRNPDIWDAMLMPIFRHRIGILAAANRYRAFCARYGTTVTTELGTTLLPPPPETTATLDDDPQVTGRRMPVLRTVAREYLRLRPDQTPLPATELYELMQKIPHIGEWSAARIVADTTGDFSFHRHTDFGARNYWRKHAINLGMFGEQLTLRALWKSCTDHECSTVIALTTHQALNTAEKAEAADISVRAYTSGTR
jgi:3-methyladenine DNA glycosylase/8-oxoguanine DNA glycosylase